MKICYYISSHGYGHAVRASAICGWFSPAVELVFRTGVPRTFFEEEIDRPFEWCEASFDCGCIQNESTTVDIPATVERYSRIADHNRTIIDEEVRWMIDHRIDGVVADMPPFVLQAAKQAGIPSAIATNFTWYNIYKEYTGDFPAFRPYVDEVRMQYATAGLMLETAPSMAMDFFTNRKSVPVVGRVGVNRRETINQTFRLDSRKQLGLIYTGTFGMGKVDWKRLEELQGWEFLGLQPLADGIHGLPDNYHAVDKNTFRYQDLTASVDVVISKIGYGTYAESLLHGVPLVYVPRTDFAEFPVLEESLLKWGLGHRIEADEFNSVAWESVLEQVVRLPRPAARPNEGARLCAEMFEDFFDEHKSRISPP